MWALVPSGIVHVLQVNVNALQQVAEENLLLFDLAGKIYIYIYILYILLYIYILYIYILYYIYIYYIYIYVLTLPPMTYREAVSE